MKFRKRKEAIEEAILEYGLKKEKKYIISFWELAGNLNNLWKAKLFIKKNGAMLGLPYLNHDKGEEWSIDHWALSEFHKPIIKTINKMKNARIIQSKEMREYFEVTL